MSDFQFIAVNQDGCSPMEHMIQDGVVVFCDDDINQTIIVTNKENKTMHEQILDKNTPIISANQNSSSSHLISEDLNHELPINLSNINAENVLKIKSFIKPPQIQYQGNAKATPGITECNNRDSTTSFKDSNDYIDFLTLSKNKKHGDEGDLKDIEIANTQSSLQSLFKVVNQDTLKSTTISEPVKLKSTTSSEPDKLKSATTSETDKLKSTATSEPVESETLASIIYLGKDNKARKVLSDFNKLKADKKIADNAEMLRQMIDSMNKSDYLTEMGCSSIKPLSKPLSKDIVLTDDLVMQIVSSNFLSASEKLTEKEDLQNVLGITALNIKAIQLSKKYFEFLSKDGFYISGFIDDSEKLNEYLKNFRLVTGSSFSIRRSKAKLNNDPEPEEKPMRKYKPGYLGKGQIKWQKNLGVPPIPFTGTPFTTEGSTTYQCIFGPKRIPAKKQFDDCSTEGPPSKKTKRESKKKDCPAQIHIRTVHRFTTYNCVTSISKDASESKSQRAIILSRLRADITNEHVVGEQGFWLRVPLPEIHCNHDLGPFDKDGSELNDETIMEMRNILHEAVSQ